jgi:hypothetical protein
MKIGDLPENQIRFTQDEVQNLEHDSVGQAKRVLTVNGLMLKPYDSFVRSLAVDGITETWTFKKDGAVSNILVLVYTDSTLNTLLNGVLT